MRALIGVPVEKDLNEGQLVKEEFSCSFPLNEIMFKYVRGRISWLISATFIVAYSEYEC